MTQRQNIAFSQDFALRGRTLAERRLSHLTELYDSGRWKRYYTESEFLVNVREARAALESWRRLELAEPVDQRKMSPAPSRFEELSSQLASSLEVKPAIKVRKNPEQEAPAKYEREIRQEILTNLDLPSWRPSLLPPIAFSTDGIGS